MRSVKMSLLTVGKARPRIENAPIGKLSDQVKQFNAKVAEHEKKQLENPFSNWEGAATKPKLSKTDENYGHPDAGTKSHARAVKAKDHIEREVDELLNVIRLLAPDDGAVLFKDLFVTYSRISDKLVGVMIRARRSGYIDFEGEMMFQGRDDKKWVCITQAGFDRHRERSVSPRPPSSASSRDLDY